MAGFVVLFHGINQSIDFIAPVFGTLIISAIWFYKANQYIQKEGFGRGSYLSVIFLIVLFVPFFVLGIFPEILAGKTGVSAGTSRWALLYLSVPSIGYFGTKKHSAGRGGLTALGHLLILLTGWFLGQWIGIIFFSLPLITILYFILYHLAQVILPTSVPESQEEIKQKFRAFTFYIWGVQFPFWAARSNAARDADMRISGDYFKGFGNPGIVWTHSHQVVGQSAGIEFNEVAGPGILFTERYERPVAIVDLRTQLRTVVDLKAVTKDGIPITAVLFTSFKIDQDDWSKWSKEDRHRVWRASPILQNGLKIDREIGSYPYSTARVHAVLSTAGVSADDTSPDVYWDEIIVERIAREARIVLSERNLNKLWLPEKDGAGKSALDEIANEINKRAKPRLQELGVQLFASRIVNFILGEDDKIRKRHVESWRAIWQQKIQERIISAESETITLQENARIYTRATLLQTVAKSLRRAREIDPHLSKYVIALHFMSTLEDLLRSSPTENAEEQQKKISEWRESVLLYKRTNKNRYDKKL